MKIDKRILLKIGISAFILFLAIRHWPDILGLVNTVFGAAFPLIIGCIIAYPINILMSCYERFWFPRTKKKVLVVLRRPVCLIGALFSMLGIIALVIGLVLPQLTDCIMLIAEKIPQGIEIVIDFVNRLHLLPEDIMVILDSVNWGSQIGKIIDILGSGVESTMTTVLTTVISVFSGTVTAILAIIFAVYLLIGKERLLRQAKSILTRYLPPLWNKRVYYVCGILNESFHNFIVGQCTEAVILGILCTIGMMIFNLPYAAMIGALIAFTALIPVAGAYIGAGVGALMILPVSPMKALVFLIFLIVLQQLEGNIIYPKVVGSSIGLPGIWVLAAVTVGGGIMGVAGMLLGVPLAATLYRIIRDDVKKGRYQKTEDSVPFSAEDSPLTEATPSPKTPKQAKRKKK